MDQKAFRVIHGWVGDILRDQERNGYRLRLRPDEGQVAELALDQPVGSMKLGDEVSVVVARSLPGLVLVVIDHTTGEGANFVREGRRPRSGEGDMLVILAAAGFFAVALGWMVLLTLPCFVLLYSLVMHRILEAKQRRTAARIDYLIDREYCRWHAMQTRQGSVP